MKLPREKTAVTLAIVGIHKKNDNNVKSNYLSMWREGSEQEAKVTPGSVIDRLQIGGNGRPWRIMINYIVKTSWLFGSVKLSNGGRGYIQGGFVRESKIGRGDGKGVAKSLIC